MAGLAAYIRLVSPRTSLNLANSTPFNFLPEGNFKRKGFMRLLLTRIS